VGDRGAVAAGRRTVTLPAVPAAALAEHLATYSQPSPKGLVFTSPRVGYSAAATSTGGMAASHPSDRPN
jgi:hypothetical protein